MSTVSRGFKGRRRPGVELPQASTWSRTSPSCRRDRHPASELEDWELTITSETDEQRRWDWAGFEALQRAGLRRPPLRHPLVKHHLGGGAAGHPARRLGHQRQLRAGHLPRRLQHQPAAGGPDRPQGLDRLPLRRPGAGARAWWAGPAAGPPPVFVEERQVGPWDPAAGQASRASGKASAIATMATPGRVAVLGRLRRRQR